MAAFGSVARRLRTGPTVKQSGENSDPVPEGQVSPLSSPAGVVRRGGRLLGMLSSLLLVSCTPSNLVALLEDSSPTPVVTPGPSATIEVTPTPALITPTAPIETPTASVVTPTATPGSSQTPVITPTPASSPTPDVTPTPPVDPPTPTGTPGVTPTPAVTPTPPIVQTPTATPQAPTPTATPVPTVAPDLDGDGYSLEAGDCNDNDASVNPAVVDDCNGVDSNCNGTVDESPNLSFWLDDDADGYGDPTKSTLACNEPKGYSSNDEDCDDTSELNYPGAAEICDGEDNNCDLQIDDGLPEVTWYPDSDADGYGASVAGGTACALPAGTVDNGLDCNDKDATQSPDKQEVTCDGKDNDCAGATTDHPDADNDGYDACAASVAGSDGKATDCNEADANINPGKTEQTCNGVDEDCDGLTDDRADADADGYDTCPAGSVPQDTLAVDCNDADKNVYPGAFETYGDSTDSDCDGIKDIAQLYAGLNPGEGGDGGAATSAQLYFPSDVALDGSGNLFVADRYNHRIRKITSGGVISTVAGTGVAGNASDGATASSSKLNYPVGVAVDASGQVYLSDGSSYIRQIASSGKLMIIGGTGTSGYNGDGQNGDQTQFNHPMGLAFNAGGDLYVADRDNHRIRKIAKDKKVSTIAGTSSSGFSGDGGSPTSAKLNSPEDVGVSAGGDIVIADTGNNRIRRIRGASISTIAGNGQTTPIASNVNGLATAVVAPGGIIMNSDNSFYFTEGDRVRKYAANDVLTTFGGTRQGFSGDGSSATDGRFAFGRGLAVSGTTLYVADQLNYRVRSIRLSDGLLGTFAGSKTPASTGVALNTPRGATLDSLGTLYVADASNNRVLKVRVGESPVAVAGTGTCNVAASLPTAGLSLDLCTPVGVAVNAGGDVFISDVETHRVWKVDAAGNASVFAGTGTAGATGDGGPATLAQLSSPTTLAVGPDNLLYISDTGNHSVRMVDGSGNLKTVVGKVGTAGYAGDAGLPTNARLSSPGGIAFDPAGVLYVADTGNNAVRKVTLGASISTFAGGNTAGFSGDNGQAVNASFNGPIGVSVRGDGVVFIADTNNNRLRQVSKDGIVRTVYGTSSSGYRGTGSASSSAELNNPVAVLMSTGNNPIVVDAYNHRLVMLEF